MPPRIADLCGGCRWCWRQLPPAASTTASYPLAGKSLICQSNCVAGCYIGVGF